MSVMSKVQSLKAENKAKAEAEARTAKVNARIVAKNKAALERLVKRILEECCVKGVKLEYGHNLIKGGRCILRLDVCCTEHERFTGDDSRGEMYHAWEVLMWDRHSKAHNEEYGRHLGTDAESIETAVAKAMEEYL